MSASDNFSLETVLGRDTFLDGGTIRCEGLTRIDGSVKGNIEVDGTLSLGAFSKVKGNIKGTSVNLAGGIVEGNIEASLKVSITQGSVVIGDVSAKSIYIEEGSVVNGHCAGLPGESELKEAVARRETKKAAEAFASQLNDGDN